MGFFPSGVQAIGKINVVVVVKCEVYWLVYFKHNSYCVDLYTCVLLVVGHWNETLKYNAF